MRAIFADTAYWTALFNERDNYHHWAVNVSTSLVGMRVVTTDEVLLEFLTFFAGYGPGSRSAAAAFVQDLLMDPQVEVLPQSRPSFLAGLVLYQDRPDKAYSGVDCVSMAAMREQAIIEVLTRDHHFVQEGFLVR